MEPSESNTNPQELDETVYKFTEACNTAFKVACPTEKPRGRKNPPGGPNNYQSSETTADACLTEQMREMRTLTGRTTSMNWPLTKWSLEERNELHGRPSALI